MASCGCQRKWGGWLGHEGKWGEVDSPRGRDPIGTVLVPWDGGNWDTDGLGRRKNGMRQGYKETIMLRGIHCRKGGTCKATFSVFDEEL